MFSVDVVSSAPSAKRLHLPEAKPPAVQTQLVECRRQRFKGNHPAAIARTNQRPSVLTFVGSHIEHQVDAVALQQSRHAAIPGPRVRTDWQAASKRCEGELWRSRCQSSVTNLVESGDAPSWEPSRTCGSPRARIDRGQTPGKYSCDASRRKMNLGRNGAIGHPPNLFRRQMGILSIHSFRQC